MKKMINYFLVTNKSIINEERFPGGEDMRVWGYEGMGL
jgi:hypothetical protein